MLIHETRSTKRGDHRWREWSTLGIVAALLASFGFAPVAFSQEQSRRDGQTEPETKPAVVVDPNWEPTNEIVFRARYKRCIPPRMRDKEGFVSALGTHGFHVIDVVEGRLGVDWLFFSAPEGSVSDGTYTFRGKPTSTAKSDLKAAYMNRMKTYHMWFWENPELIHVAAKSP